jgi:hypothetical protein
VWALCDRRYEFGYVGPLPKDMNDGFFRPDRYGVPEGTRDVLETLPEELRGPTPTAFYRMASRFATDLSFLDTTPRTGETYSWLYIGAGGVLAVFYIATFAVLPPLLPPRRRFVFAAFSVFLVLLYSKGWSPQFVAYLVPLLLIVFPPVEGGLYALAFTVTAFLETPVWSHYAFGRPGATTVANLLLQVAVLARTTLLVVVTARLYPRLFRD